MDLVNDCLDLKFLQASSTHSNLAKIKLDRRHSINLGVSTKVNRNTWGERKR